MLGELIPIVLFLSIAAIAILRGPLGRALADRIAGRAGGGESGKAVEELRVEVRAEIEEVRERLLEMEERLDFTERMLAQQKHRQITGGEG